MFGELMKRIDSQSENGVYVSVLPIGPFDSAFSYKSNIELQIGDVVEIPFRNRKIVGIVAEEKSRTDIELKSISKVFEFNIGRIYYDFLKWVAAYTLIPAGNVLKMILSEKSVFSSKQLQYQAAEITNIIPQSAITLNDAQSAAYDAIKKNNSLLKPFLLQGVTGSGKTEVYLSAIRDILQNNQQILILLPEIALTGQLCQRIKKYFGFDPLTWNSNISPKKRRKIWQRAIWGEKCIVVGTRSALFLPFKNLGLIVVDEEHDSSYKQEEGGFYNARDMAVVLGHLSQIPVILSSATPSLESYINTRNGKYGHAFIENRFGISRTPSIELIDMRQNEVNDGFISHIMLNSIKDTIARNEQCLIYLNRRGYSPVTLCKSCGEKLACPNCTSWLVYHKNINKIVCHYCGHKIGIPAECGHCGEKHSFIQFGPGVERVFEELSTKIPEAEIIIASSDTMSSDKKIFELLEKIHNNDVDIIIGTQILSKGHHFPNITLVGIVDGDLGLNGADLRAAEKTYQLINQVSGRAGRAEKSGKILIQTFNTEHSLYTSLKENTVEKFIDLEIASRKKSDQPPFTRFASIIISGTNRALTEETAKRLASACPKELTMFGPAPAPFFLLRGRVRWRILMKAAKNFLINKAIRKWLSSQNIPKNVKIQIDIDPISFL